MSENEPNCQLCSLVSTYTISWHSGLNGQCGGPEQAAWIPWLDPNTAYGIYFSRWRLRIEIYYIFSKYRPMLTPNHACHKIPKIEQPSKHVYMGPIWAESGHLSHSGPAWALYRLFCPYKTYIGPILVNFDQQTRIYGNHMGRFGAFIPFGSYLGPI